VNKILYFILFSLLALTKSVSAQERNIFYLSVSKGLPQSQVNKVFHDSRGFIWVATAGGGVAFYNGENFRVFNEDNGLAGNIVYDIEEDKNGNILCTSSWGGISYINHDKVEKIIQPLEETAAIKSFTKDDYGVIWAVGKSLSYIDNKRLIHVESDLTLPFINKPCLAAKGDKLYLGTNKSIIVIDVLTKKQLYSIATNYQIENIFITSHNEILVATLNSGCFNLSENKLIKLPFFENKEAEIQILTMGESPNGDIWVGEEEGVYIFKRDSGKLISEPEFIKLGSSKSICFDRQGNKWIGTNGKGLARIINTPFLFFDDVEGLNSSNNFAIAEDILGGMYFANSSKGVYYYYKEHLHTYNTTNGLPSNSAKSLCYANNKMYVGTTKGAAYIENNSIYVLDTYKDYSIKSLVADDQNNIYLGTLGDGLWIHQEDGKDSLIDTFDNLNIHSLEYSKKWGVIIGTNGGLFLKKNGNYVRIKKGLPNLYIGNICIDKNDKIWVGTDKGIARLDGDEFQTFSTEDGLISNTIYSLLADNNGFLWAGTNKGTNKISINYNSEPVKFKTYSANEGFKGIESNTGGIYESHSGDIYFSTIVGIHQYKPILDYNYNYNTPIYLNNIRLFLDDFDYRNLGSSKLSYFNIPQKITLEANENHVTIDYFAINYLPIENIKYTYYLEGFDKHWSPPTTSKSAIYANLPPGNYTFRVKEFENEFSRVGELKIKINVAPPPFYKKTWFVLFVLFTTFFVIYYFTIYRTKQLIRESQALEYKVQERTQQILEREREKTILLQEVHHRVKNNLQIIISLFRLQTHFTENEEAKELFLNSQNRILSMAKIHEKLYQSKELSNIEAKTYLEELVSEIVQSYDTRNAVFLTLDIDDCKINLDDLTPLALIVNEIISNSLKYGFINESKPQIYFKLTQNIGSRTKIIIGDNGKGFDRSKFDTPDSMGMELIKTLTEQLDGEIVLDFNDNSPFYTLKFKAKMQ